MTINKIKILFFITLLTTSCSHGLPLDNSYTTPANKIFLKAIKPTTIYIKEFKDERDTINYNVIGKINEVVADINSNELTLSKEANIALTQAIKKEFNNSGFTLSEDSPELTISGTIKEFALNIDDTDNITMKIEYKIVRNKDNKVIFDGLALVSDSRFIGVTGNTRKSINNYLNIALYSISRQVLNSTGLVIEAQIEKPIKDSFSTLPDYEIKNKAVTTEDNKGTFYGYGTPNKIKVYIEGVYYGQTPISIKLKPGIYNVSFKKKGFKEEKEKISIREKKQTKLELDLQRDAALD